MLQFVRRLREQRQTEDRTRGILAFRSLIGTLTPIGYVRPTLRRVTKDMPYQGPFLENDMTLALQPDGTPLHAYMIDGYAIDDLWIGFDKAACQRYLDTLTDTTHQLRVYDFTPTLAALACAATGNTLCANTYTRLVEYKDFFLPLTELQFRRIYLRKPTTAPRPRIPLPRAA